MISTRTRKFLSYYRPYWHLFVADMLAALLISAIALAIPLLARYLTKDVLAGVTSQTIGQIYAVGALMVLLVAVHALCNFFVDYMGHTMGALMESDMRAELFAHYQHLPFSFYDERQTGQLMSRITHDLFLLSELYHHGPEDLAIALINLIGVIAISFTLDLQLTLVILFFVPIMTIYAYYFNRKMRVAVRKSKERVGDINAQVEDTLAGIRVVQSFTNEHIETAKFAHENNRFIESRRDDYRSSAYLFAGMIGFSQLITIAVLVVGGVRIANGALDLADLLAYLLYVGILVEPVQRLVNFARLYQEGITGFNRFMDILEITPDIHDAPDATSPSHIHGDIRFVDVSYRYHPDSPVVLHNLSLDIQRGEFVALVGTSGVGKTTLCSLIPRFYDVTAGAILLDGIDIRDISLRSLRAHIGVVHQDVYLFAGTVAQNIAYGKRDATRAEVIAAAIKANAHDFITALPRGYDTDIGQRGVKLSGGQKQRLSIARVFLKDPPVIIFDEATSSLDTESEKAVQRALEELASSRTTLVIAHRLSTVKNAHRILVMTENGIEEQGTHEALVARGGTYANLYNAVLGTV